MGKLASASTVYATAYLTEKGRKYLFNQGNIRFDSAGNDLLEILYFTLSDVDTNYQTAARLISGDVPDISGKNDNCIKATSDYTQTNLLYQTVDALILSDPLYSVNLPNNTLTLNVDSSSDFPPATDTPPVPTSPTSPIYGGAQNNGIPTLITETEFRGQ
jgi:hypothetical protein